MITHRQRHALNVLQQRHAANPAYDAFPMAILGEHTAALLRRLVPLGLVHATKGGPGTRQFFSITDAGRAALRDAEEGGE